MNRDAPWSDTGMRSWQDLRTEMPIVASFAYFDHAAVAPLSAPAAQTLHEWTTDSTDNGAIHWGKWRSRIEDTRETVCRMVNAKSTEIALIRNTTEGVSLIAEGFPWRDGDNVITLSEEFPSNLYPWQNLRSRGVEVRQVSTKGERFDLNDLVEACDDRTRLVALSWVGYTTGWRNDLDELVEAVHRCGAQLFVDGIQGLGVLPLDVRATPIDYLAADGHKWMLGPEGAGVLYIKESHLADLRPLGIGWNSVVHAGRFDDKSLILKEAAARYEGGTYNMCGTVALGASLKALESLGTQQRFARLVEVTERLSEQLKTQGAIIHSDRSRHRASGIVAAEFPGRDPKELQRQCRAQSVIVNCRGGYLRVSPHVYTSDDDIERLVDALRQ